MMAIINDGLKLQHYRSSSSNHGWLQCCSFLLNFAQLCFALCLRLLRLSEFSFFSLLFFFCLTLISPQPLPCATLITHSAVCHLIVAIVMLITAPHAEMEEKKKKVIPFSICLSTHQESAAHASPPSPLHSLIFPSSPCPSFYPSILYVFYNRCDNRLIWKTLNYRAPSHLPTYPPRRPCPPSHPPSTHTHTELQRCHQNRLLHLSSCLKKLVISFNCVSLCENNTCFNLP